MAIEAVDQVENPVLDGPPGTRKSRTTANLIVGYRAAGRSILFAGEMSAALDVVKRRLDEGMVYNIYSLYVQVVRSKIPRLPGEYFQYVGIGEAALTAGSILEQERPAAQELRSSPGSEESGFQPTAEPTGFQQAVVQFIYSYIIIIIR